MPKIEFTEDVIHETDGRNQGRRYARGSQYSVSEAVARKWVEGRGVAKRVDPSIAPSALPPAPEGPPALEGSGAQKGEEGSQESDGPGASQELINASSQSKEPSKDGASGAGKDGGAAAGKGSGATKSASKKDAK